MTEEKKSASPNSLTEASQGAKIELTEAQLKDVAGGLTFNGVPAQTTDHKASDSPIQAASLNFTVKL